MLAYFNGSGGFGGGFGNSDSGYNAHERCNDYYEYKETSGGGGNGSGNNPKGGGGLPDWGCGWIVIVIVAILLISFIFNDASRDAIDSLLGFGFLAFLFAKNLFR